MKTCTVQDLKSLSDLIARTQGIDEPVVVFDGGDECLVAMRPPVFERVLFETERLERAGRKTLHL